MYLTRDMEKVLLECSKELECTVVYGPRQVAQIRIFLPSINMDKNAILEL